MVKIKYIGGKGIQLSPPLSDGRSIFNRGEIYEIEDTDFARLLNSPVKVFEEVIEEKEVVKPATTVKLDNNKEEEKAAQDTARPVTKEPKTD